MSALRNASVVVLGAALLLVGPAAQARRDHTLLGEVIKGARLLGQARYDEAQVIVDGLRAHVAPGKAVGAGGDAADAAEPLELRWLRAELAFHHGQYAVAKGLLAGLPDAAVDGQVGSTRTLVESSLAVTADFVQVQSAKGHFIVLYKAGPDEAIASLAGDVLDAVWETLRDDLGTAPADPIRVELLGAPADLAKLSPLTEAEIETTGTIALSKYNKLMVVSPRATVFGYPWMDTLAHEYTHLVVSRASWDTVPVWMQEGLARFEQTRWRTGPGVTLSAAEQTILATGLKKGRLITFEEMNPSMAKLPSQEAAALAYAEVYTLVGWIHAQVGYPGLTRILQAQRDGTSAKRAVTDAIGTPWPDVDRDWKAYLHELEPAAAKVRSANRGIRFSRGSGAADNVGVDQVAAKARKLTRLGGMLRARGHLDAAAIEYEKALAASGGDPFVAGKLARTLVELGRNERAVEIAQPLLDADRNDATAAVTVGLAHAALGEWQPAAAAFQLALEVSPFDPATRCGLADAYGRLGDKRAERERRACELVRN